MKKVLALTVLVVIAFVVFKSGAFEAAPAKQYRQQRQAYMAARGYAKDSVPSARWKLDIDSCEVNGQSAVILATEHTSKLPPNSASFVFATNITRRLRVEMEEENGVWRVVSEEVLDEQVSTYQDRKNQ